jgi:ABC-2 type transport system ATP-binding protein
VPQDDNLDPDLTVRENLLIYGMLFGISKPDMEARVPQLLQWMQLTEKADARVNQLSGGMKRRLTIARGLVNDPDLIILDEPFSGLDPVNANLIKDEIYGLAQRGCTVIFSTHRMEQVEEICDHIVLVNLGRKILDGTVAEIKQQFKENIYKIKLQELTTAINSEAFQIVDQTANNISVKINEGFNGNDVLKYFIQQNLNIESFNEVLPSLNEIFINLVDGSKATTRAFQSIND